MNIKRFTAGLYLFFIAITLGYAQESPLTLENIFSKGYFAAKQPPQIKMGNKGSEYYHLETSKQGNQISQSIILSDFDNSLKSDTLFNTLGYANYPKQFVIEDFQVSNKSNYILLQGNSKHLYRHSTESEYYLIFIGRKDIPALQLSKDKVSYATISPSEKHIAYVFNNNLYLYSIDTRKTTAITNDGKINEIINGKTDWVYEEEFGLVKGFEFSPNGEQIAFYRFDEKRVKEVSLPRYDSTYHTFYTFKYPKVGEQNSIVSVWVYDVNKDTKRKLLLDEHKDQYIPRIKWSNNPNGLAVYRLNRLQNDLEILMVYTSSWDMKTLYRERKSTYIDINDNLLFLKDNSFLITSNIEGYNQIYHYASTGLLIAKITKDSFDVDVLQGYDDEQKRIYYRAFYPKPTMKRVCSILLKGNGFTTYGLLDSGTNNINWTPNFKYGVLSESSAKTVPIYTVINSKGKITSELEANFELDIRIKKTEYNNKEFITIPLQDGIKLNAWMIKPKSFTPLKKYPVLFTIYSGPGSQTVKDEFGGGMEAWYQMLASKGYIIVSVDNRGTGGRGDAFQTITYKKLGLIESDDMIAAAKYLGSLNYIDKNRIGINGWSFGGYMSLMCLLRGNDVFKTAISVAPVTDWRFYDNIYTERYMQREVDNKTGYDQTSVLSYVNNLKEHQKLLLMHGTFDDNVHPQNSYFLVKKLVELNKKFDSEWYPDKSHGISGGLTRLHIYSRITDFILNNL